MLGREAGGRRQSGPCAAQRRERARDVVAMLDARRCGGARSRVWRKRGWLAGRNKAGKLSSLLGGQLRPPRSRSLSSFVCALQLPAIPILCACLVSLESRRRKGKEEGRAARTRRRARLASRRPVDVRTWSFRLERKSFVPPAPRSSLSDLHSPPSRSLQLPFPRECRSVRPRSVRRTCVYAD